ncbi:MAG: tyrosine-type recombinase/integrase [Bacteriovorax sp.]
MIKFNEAKKTYEVSYSRRHPVTKQSMSIKRIGIKSQEEAKRTYNDLIITMEKKINRSMFPLWPVMVDRFLEAFRNRGIANNTVLNYQSCLYAHTYNQWRKKGINDITTSDVRKLILEDLAHLSEASRKSMLKYIRAVFSFALDSGIVMRDPCPKLKFKKNLKIKSVLKENEISLLLQKAKEVDHPWFPVWALACYTGLRNGELYALKWDRVDFDKRIMIISLSWNADNGFKETKSGDDRIVEIAESLLPLLKEIYENRTNEFVLPRLELWEKGNQARILRDFLHECNLPQIRFHDLRASWATVMLSKGVEPIKVMSMGGWRDLKTMQIYIRKSGINIQGITNQLNFL